MPIPRNGQGHVKLSRQKSMSDWSVGINNFNDSIFITKSVFERIHYGIIITEYLTLCICEGNIWPVVKFLSPWTSSCSNMIPIPTTNKALFLLVNTCHHIKTSQLICGPHQLTDLYIVVILTLNGLINWQFPALQK